MNTINVSSNGVCCAAVLLSNDVCFAAVLMCSLGADGAGQQGGEDKRHHQAASVLQKVISLDFFVASSCRSNTYHLENKASCVQLSRDVLLQAQVWRAHWTRAAVARWRSSFK